MEILFGIKLSGLRKGERWRQGGIFRARIYRELIRKNRNCTRLDVGENGIITNHPSAQVLEGRPWRGEGSAYSDGEPDKEIMQAKGEGGSSDCPWSEASRERNYRENWKA